MLVKFVILVIIVQTVLCQDESVKRCARAVGACMLAPEATQGPYYWNSTVRQDITEGRPGLTLRLAITVLDTRLCLPIPNAVVDLWHCDGTGLYSHYIAASQGQMGGPTDASTFFRGQQITDYQGVAVFNTIYPGWYQGRATHMHVKVHIGASLVSIGGIIHVIGGHVSHTGQFFFDDRMTDAVATFPPYSSHIIQRTRNDEDMIYLQANGASMIIPITFPTNTFTGGMAGEITVGVDPTATPVEIGPPPPPFGPAPNAPPKGR